MDLGALRPWELYDTVAGVPEGVGELLGLYCNSVEEVLLLSGRRDRPFGVVRLAGLRLLPTRALPPGTYALLPLAVDAVLGTPVLVTRCDEFGPLAA